jgi:hypothetical protein
LQGNDDILPLPLQKMITKTISLFYLINVLRIVQDRLFTSVRLVAFLFFSSPVLAAQVPLGTQPDQEIATLVRKAMADGSAEGEVSGPFRDQFRTAIKNPSARVFVNIKKLADLRQEGCKRLKMSYSASGTFLKSKADGSQHPFNFWIEINMCENDLPPTSTEGAKPLFPSKATTQPKKVSVK